MKICIDGFGVTNLSGTGIYTYTYELLTNLFKIYPQPKYDIIWNNSMPLTNWRIYKNINYTKSNINRKNDDYIKLNQHIKDNKIKIFHSPNNGFSIPDNKICSQVMTVHDLIALSNKEYTDIKYYNKFINKFPKAIKNVDHIITVSNFLKKQLIEYYNINENRISVIYPGFSNKFHQVTKAQSKYFLKNRYNIISDFLLYVGSIHKRKNLDKLILTFKEVKKKIKGIKLIIIGNITGKRQSYFLYLKNLTKHLDIEHDVIFLGRVDYMHMPFFYKSSICLINLSNYEGFPLSIIEAMACNIPVICNNTPFFQEILKSDIFLVPYNDIDVIKDSIIDVIKNTYYKKQCLMLEKKQLKNFEWENSIKETVKVYESIV